MAVFLRDLAPAIFRLRAGLEGTFHLSRAFHELVEIHRTELATDHPEIAACGHCQSPVAVARSAWNSTRLQADRRTVSISRTGSSCYGRRPPSEPLRPRSTPCDRR